MGSTRPKKLGRPSSPGAEHRRVAIEMRTLLAAGTWHSGEVLPSLRQLAERLGTSFNAMRRAVELLKLEKRIAQNARRRLTAIGGAGPLMDGRGMVLVVSSDPLGGPWSDYRTALNSGVVQGAGDIGAPILLAHGIAMRIAMPVGFLDYPICGVVLVGHFKARLMRQYERLPVPVVIADTPAAAYKMHSVCVDNFGAMKTAVQHLVALGHRRIGFARFILYSLNDVDPDSKERHAGFMQACLEARLPVRTDWTFNVMPGGGVGSLRRLVDQSSGFTSAIAVDQGIAAQVHRAATKAGREVPRQFGIVTVNGKGFTSQYSGPLVDFVELGRRAAPLLQAPKSPPVRIQVAVGWHEAGSVQNCKS